MKKITDEELKKTITNLAETFDQELFAKSQDQLEEYWFFKWDISKSIHLNIYDFYDELKLYENFCRRWETKHNGSCCVVERVRDQYLMPKIKEFYNTLSEKQ